MRIPLGLAEEGQAQCRDPSPHSDFGNDPADAAFHGEGGKGPKGSIQTFQNLEDP